MNVTKGNVEHRVDPYCTHCGYDFVGLPHLRCPECGRHYHQDMYDLRPLDERVNKHSRRLMRGPLLLAALVFATALFTAGLPDLSAAMVVGCLLTVPLAGLLAIQDATKCVNVNTLRTRLANRKPLYARDRIVGQGVQIAFILMLQAYVAVMFAVMAAGFGYAIGHGGYYMLVAAADNWLPPATQQ